MYKYIYNLKHSPLSGNFFKTTCHPYCSRKTRRHTKFRSRASERRIVHWDKLFGTYRASIIGLKLYYRPNNAPKANLSAENNRNSDISVVFKKQGKRQCIHNRHLIVNKQWHKTYINNNNNVFSVLIRTDDNSE